MARRPRGPLTHAERGRMGGMATSARTDMRARGALAQKKKEAEELADVLELAALMGETLTEAEINRRLAAKKALRMQRMTAARMRKEAEAA